MLADEGSEVGEGEAAEPRAGGRRRGGRRVRGRRLLLWMLLVGGMRRGIASPSASAAAAPPLLSPPPSRAPAAAPAAPRSPRAPSSPPSPACPCPAPPPPPVPCRPPVAARGGAPRRRRWRAGPSVCLPFFAWRWWTKFQQCARHHLRRRLHVGRQELHEAGRLVGGRRAVPRRQRRGGGLGDWRGVG